MFGWAFYVHRRNAVSGSNVGHGPTIRPQQRPLAEHQLYRDSVDK